MERLRTMLKRKRKGDPLDYVRDLSLAILQGRVIGDEVLFHDAVNEIYGTLKGALFRGDEHREELIRAYELAVILKYLVHDGVKTSREILEELVKTLE
ncbi:hypothetical protein A3L09_08675 [Thermococcus profundus]|uniref:Uncharacterized protein n=1 Tax=Thermococcus profundus TaxID=49899 RepID=A0A2Z2MF69_THEPR|nr:hypothetical protein [Thermococcus profundus]ASJ03325.1 hypothetical protein A3L09_08675 [Thermococcus profundus]